MSIFNDIYEIFFDTEFTGLRQDTSLISIGCITENSEVFYFENIEYNRDQVDHWIKNNVIENLEFLDKIDNMMTNFVTSDSRKLQEVIGFGEFDFLRNQFKIWLENIHNTYQKDILFISDVSHYDTVLLFELFNGALHVPDYIIPFVWDINMDICQYLNISPREAFNLNREELAEKLSNTLIDQRRKHNSLHDARMIKLIFESIYRNHWF